MRPYPVSDSESTVTTKTDAIRVGDIVELHVGNVGHGGMCIARHEGRVVFVRHTLPGEFIRAEITEITSKFLRADCIDVLESSEFRVTPPCALASVCGGCDWQHVSVNHQLELKSTVVREQLSHLAKLTEVNGAPLADFHVQPMSDDTSGLRWRTRNRFAKISDDSIGLRMNRSHSLVEVDECLIAVDGATELARSQAKFATDEVEVAKSSTDEMVVVDQRGGPWLTETVEERSWRIHASSFWQIHTLAPTTFVRTVRELAQPQEGEAILDLYAGSGLFAATLAKDVGDSGEIVAVESAIDAVRDARRSCSDLHTVELVTAKVEKWVTDYQGEPFDIVIADPPRTGAGREVTARMAALATRAIVYVACDPSALGRDASYLAEQGWTMTALRAFDAFPMTSHIESIALFERR